MALPQVDVEQSLLRAMELHLSDLAARWRGTPDGEMRNEIARHHQAVLRCMVELGYREPLAAESELPEYLMPREYLDLF